VSRAKAPPLEQSLRTAIAVARAAGATRLKVKRPDGSSYTIDLKPEADPADVNDFDRPPNPLPANRGSGT
jgi:hypothetical protein